MEADSILSMADQLIKNGYEKNYIYSLTCEDIFRLYVEQK